MTFSLVLLVAFLGIVVFYVGGQIDLSFMERDARRYWKKNLVKNQLNKLKFKRYGTQANGGEEGVEQDSSRNVASLNSKLATPSP